MATGKTELLTILAKKTGFAQKQVAQFIDSFLETVTENLSRVTGCS